MKLQDLLTKFDYTCERGCVDTEVSHLVYDSRKVQPGDVFVCISGAARDAHDFVAEVAEKGAAAIIVEKDVTEQLRTAAGKDVTLIRTADTRLALACMSADYFGNPAEKLTTIGITGTKGKTTTTYMVKSVLEKAGIPTGLIGTIETIIGQEHTPANNTTPESYIIQETFARMVDAGLRCVVMEVSSQGLMLHRVSGFTFDFGIFTNLSEDHIGPNEHKDFADYLRCKAMLFKQCRIGIVNADDPHVGEILKDATCKVETLALEHPADLKASDLELFTKPGILGIRYQLTGRAGLYAGIGIPDKTHAAASEISDCSTASRQMGGSKACSAKGGNFQDDIPPNNNPCNDTAQNDTPHNDTVQDTSIRMEVEIDIPGRFSVYNSLTAIAVCLHFTDDLSLIQEVLKQVQVKGRVEIVPVSDSFTLMIDYAHNAMSLESLLLALKEYHPKRIVTLFGCGGNRARARRFEMGEVSSRLSDFSIITSDNPRFEEPMDIINDILTGVQKADGDYIMIEDRTQAIAYAIDHGQEGDVIVIAGKGHEDYQEIRGVKHHFSDREVVEAHVQSRRESAITNGHVKND